MQFKAVLVLNRVPEVLKIHLSRWTCLLYGFATDYLTANRANLERMIRDQGRSTQVSSSSQNLASILDRYVPEWMGEDRCRWFLLSFSTGTESRLFRSANEIGVPRSSWTIFAECESSKTPR